MLELEEARRRIIATIPTLPAEPVRLSAAAGRILAEPILSPLDLPCFDNSAMDGYAVRAGDLKGASADNPVSLKVCGQSPAGEVFQGTIERGTCVRVFTGSALPAGADAVVMQEDTRLVPGRAGPPPLGATARRDLGPCRSNAEAGEILVLESVKPWENARLQGEDVKRGAQLLSAGETVTVGALGLLAAVGMEGIQVNRQPLIGLLSTGSELREAGQPLGPGRIYESNRVTLAALLAQAGAIPKVFPLVPDTLAGTRAMLENAFCECDGLITTGGVSVGEHDFVKAAFEQLGGVTDFWKVAIRPGKPFVFGRWRGKCLFGLPGNPVSALVTFLLLVRPAVLRWQGAANVDLATSPGTLAEPLVNRGDRRHFMRVALDGAGTVRSAGIQGSHILSSLAKANGLVDVPPQTTLAAGTAVAVLRWG